MSVLGFSSPFRATPTSSARRPEGFSSPFRAPAPSPSRRPRRVRPALENLEPRLALSDLIGVASTAEVTTEPPNDPNEPPPGPDGEPPIVPTPIPEGPVLPA